MGWRGIGATLAMRSGGKAIKNLYKIVPVDVCELITKIWGASNCSCSSEETERTQTPLSVVAFSVFLPGMCLPVKVSRWNFRSYH